ncbi:MAG: 3-isopropylmalate dehydrogenase [Erythrobacter sp.]|jgi:3-isopropylmalate dehydrogenase|nr:3-isopropylmalate dehydrogenase [Erythrobacter sp.]
MKIAVLPGDGIGPEVTREAVRVLEALALPGLVFEEADIGGAAYRRHGHPLPEATLAAAREADAVLFGAVGDPSCDALERALRPEQAILGLRRELGLFANLRPARVFPGLEALSPLRLEIARALDLLIVRELTGDVYFGDKGVRPTADGHREGWDLMSYSVPEIRRIGAVAFRAAEGMGAGLVSVDKANVLETSQVWREEMIALGEEHPQVALEHLYVDNAAMQIIANPERFRVMVTGNLFGDILSDLASAAVGSIGLLPSASLGERQTQHGTFGLYEPIHGSAPDIAGQGKANPMATILSAAMMLRHSFRLNEAAERIEAAVAQALADGILGADLGGSHGTQGIGEAVIERLGG